MKIYEGDKIPFGYGFAWDNWHSLTRTAYLIPFNFLFRWIRNGWIILHKPRNHKENAAFVAGAKYGESVGYEKGLKKGEKIGEDAALRVMERFMKSRLKDL